MAASFYRFELLLLLLLLVPACHGFNSYCGSGSGSNNSSHLKANIGRVLADLAARARSSGYAVSSSGTGSNSVYGLAQCRGDVSPDDCSACVADAARDLPRACPGGADGRILYDYCFVRYKDDDGGFLGRVDTGYAVIYANVETAPEGERFDGEVGELMTRVREEAARKGGLGRGQTQFTPYVTIYGLAQCTGDLAPLGCAQCLATAVGKLPDYCRYRKGCQINYSSCRVRYEVYPFFFPLDSGKATTQGSYTKLVINP